MGAGEDQRSAAQHVAGCLIVATSKRQRAAPPRDAAGGLQNEMLAGSQTCISALSIPTQAAGDYADWPSGYANAHAARNAPLVYRDPWIPDDAQEGSAEAPRRLGKNARFSLKIATIVRSHAQKALAHRLPDLTPGDMRVALEELKRHGLQFEDAYYAGESDTRPARWGEPTASNLLCRGKNAPFRSLKAVPRAYLNAALEVSHLPLKAAPLDRARFGRIVGLTQAERVECRAYQVRPCDMSIEQARRDTYRRSQAKRRANMSDEQREAEKKRNAERMAAKRQAEREFRGAATLAVWSLWLRRLETLCVNSLLKEKNSGLLTHAPAGGEGA